MDRGAAHFGKQRKAEKEVRAGLHGPQRSDAKPEEWRAQAASPLEPFDPVTVLGDVRALWTDRSSGDLRDADRAHTVIELITGGPSSEGSSYRLQQVHGSTVRVVGSVSPSSPARAPSPTAEGTTPMGGSTGDALVTATPSHASSS